MSPGNGADNEFLSEAEDLVETLGREMMRYEEALQSSARIDPDILNGIFRAAHSLKGLAGMFGYTNIGETAHSMENLLDKMRLGKVPPEAGVLDLLFAGVDGLRTLLKEEEADVEKVRSVAKKMDMAAQGELPGGEKRGAEPRMEETAEGDSVLIEGVALPRSIVEVLTEYEEFRLLENIRTGTNVLKVKAAFDITSFDSQLPELMNWLKKRGEVITTLPGTAEEESEHIHFDLLVGTEQPIEKLREELEEKGFSLEVLRSAEEAQAAQSRPSAQAAAPDGESGEDREENGEAESEADAESARSISSTVRVDISRLDHLMNIVGELVLEKTIIGNIRDRISREPAMRLVSNELYKAHRNLDRKLYELQEAVMDVRMVPVGQLFGRLGRIVRKLSREQGKEIELVRSGMETELDKLLVEELADPLMHIIRNSIDHGLESAEERKRKGKPVKGVIELRAFQRGNHVVIQVEDDGRGIDLQKVKERGVALGLLSPETEASEEEIFNLLFEPGFSTREEVSEISGRGVGLDVVKRNISNLSGLIEVNSEPGEGTIFTITLPITLAIIQALIVESCGYTYALPLNSVKECHILEPEDIDTIEQREIMEIREQTIPLLRLSVLFGYEDGNGGPPGRRAEPVSVEALPEEYAALAEEEGKEFVVIVGIADKRMGVVVDRLAGRQDVVIKSLGKTLGDIRGVAGATELGNQQTVLVLDVGDLLGEAGHGAERTTGFAGEA